MELCELPFICVALYKLLGHSVPTLHLKMEVMEALGQCLPDTNFFPFGAVAGDWLDIRTQDFVHAKQVLYQCAMSPAQCSFK